MTARFIPSPYPGGRIVLRSGAVDVGAVFPDRLARLLDTLGMHPEFYHWTRPVEGAEEPPF